MNHLLDSEEKLAQRFCQMMTTPTLHHFYVVLHTSNIAKYALYIHYIAFAI